MNRGKMSLAGPQFGGADKSLQRRVLHPH